MRIDVVNKISKGKTVAIPNGPHTVAQTASALNVATSTVRTWIAQGRLRHIRLGRTVRVPEVEIARVLIEGVEPLRRR